MGDDPSKMTFVICVRKSDAKTIVPGSTDDHCHDCTQVVTVSPGTRASIKDGPHVFVCFQCTKKWDSPTA